ncbi:hypothetical protein KAJ26_08010 [bacterium]|nr:hypothetical protein [bacterium]
MNEEKQIYEQGKESFPAWWIILENLGFLLNWGLGFIILLPFSFIYLSCSFAHLSNPSEKA